MIRKIKARAKSCTGASLSMALLLFLVCTVVGTVVLTAATAASGRAAELAEMDQRYYSVSSAARLLAGELDGKTVKFVRTIKEITTEGPDGSNTVSYYSAKISYQDKPDIMLFSTEDKDNVENNKLAEMLNPALNPASNISLLTRLSVYLMFDDGPNPADYSDDYYEKAMEWTLDDFYDRNHSDLFSTPDDGMFYIIPCRSMEALQDMLKVSCQCRIKGTTLYIDVSNDTTQPNGNKYTLTVAVEPSFETEPFTIDEDNMSVDEEKGETKQITVQSEVSTITWKVKGIV